jgi:hypothetical protein
MNDKADLIIKQLEDLTKSMQEMRDKVVTKAYILDAFQEADSRLLATTQEALKEQADNTNTGESRANDCPTGTKGDAPDIKMEGDGQGQTEECSVVGGDR